MTARQKLFSYVVARDYGFAPNPFFGFCTLANCKPEIRKSAEVGDWIIGTSSIFSHQHNGGLVYFMKITEILTFNEYWNDQRFQIKKPDFYKSAKFAYGDNIYHQENGEWCQELSHHRKDINEINKRNLERDTSVDKVLISDCFGYYGKEPLKMPEKLSGIVKHGQGHRCRFSEPLLSNAINWLNGIERKKIYNPAILKKNISTYQDFVKQSLKRSLKKKNVMQVLALGLVGEIGSVHSSIKKGIRDGNTNEYYKKELTEELGDVLWYAVAICCRHDIDIGELLLNNLKRIKNDPSIITVDYPRLKRADLSDLKEIEIPEFIDSFYEYEKIAKKTAKIKASKKRELFAYCYLLSLVGHKIYESLIFPNSENFEHLKNRLGDLCWYLVKIASYDEISLDDVADKNRDKASNLFKKSIKDLKKKNKFYDSGYPHKEQLPRELTVYFYNEDEDEDEDKDKDKEISYVVINSIPLGDPLDDNSIDADGYRYHDGIHFTLYALLGWSPVWRGFLHKKRKTDTKIDGTQDGARAKIVEEMIVKMIHSYFEELGDSMTKGSVNHSLLKTIQLLAKGLEIDDVTLSQWKEVIIKSQKIYSELHRNKGGKLIINLGKRNIKYRKLTEEEKEYRFKPCK